MHRPRFGMQKPARQALPAGGIPILYPDLLAEERDDAVEEITDSGDHVLDLAGEGGDLLLGAGELLERVLHGLHLREQGVRVELFERAGRGSRAGSSGRP